MKCPECKTASFTTKEYEMEHIDICSSCSGVWLDEGEIQSIISNKVTTFSEDEVRKTVSAAFSGIPLQERKSIKECPKCHVNMKPINYTIDSGVIIDKCPKNHGIWLNKHELEKVQQYRDYWQEKGFDNNEKLTKLISTPTPSEEENSSLLFGLAVSAAQLWVKITK